MKHLKCVSSDEAVPVDGQPTKPCSDCPLARTALPGWLGDGTVDEWIQMLHGETHIDCHTMIGPQCAGAAIYRANVCKTPRDRRLLRLRPDTATVFATPLEFKEHHTKGPK